MTTKRLIGDTKDAIPQSYATPITQQKAQEMVDTILGVMGLGVRVNVKFTGYRTRSRYGYFRRVLAHYEMIIHLRGENEGTIIHELAHLKGQMHDRTYQDFQAKLIDVWYGTNKEEMKMAAGSEQEGMLKLNVVDIFPPTLVVEKMVDTKDSQSRKDAVLKSILSLPMEEMRDVIERAWSTYKEMRDHDARKLVSQFGRGTKVKYVGRSGKLPYGTVGTVVRPKEKFVLVDFGGYGQWNCPATNLFKV